MNTKELMGQAQKIMTRYASNGLDGDAKREMSRMVGRFFSERVSCLHKSDIMERMATPMKALAWFNTYLCDICWRSHCCSDGQAGQTADTCQLS